MKIKPIKKIYDAHLHFPMKLKEPYAALRGEVMAARLCGGLMIINSDIEASVFWANFDSIMSGDLGFTPQVAFVLNIHSETWRENFDRMRKREFRYIVKLHPRISNITRKDFDSVRDKLMTIDAEAIVVDNWVFGPQMENHIGTELTIYLSQNLPDKRIIMAHAGGVRILETMLLTRPLESVYFDLAETCCYFNLSKHFILFFIWKRAHLEQAVNSVSNMAEEGWDNFAL